MSSMIEEQARRVYRVGSIVRRYMACVEEIINIPILLERFTALTKEGRLNPVISEIVLQSKIEFHYEEE